MSELARQEGRVLRQSQVRELKGPLRMTQLERPLAMKRSVDFH